MHNNRQNRFVFVAPMFNASTTLKQLLFSLYGQSYENWMLVLIDDVSSPDEVKKEKSILESFAPFAKKHELKYNPLDVDEDTWIPFRPNVTYYGSNVRLIENKEKKWEVENVLFGIKMYANDDDIICRIDADDWLTDLDALRILNDAYNNTEADAIWTAHRWGFTDQNISGPMPMQADPYKHPWVSSHLKTFRKKLINNVNDVNFRGEDGKYIRRAGDQAIYLPVLKNAQTFGYLPRCMYHYTIKTGDPSIFQTDDAKFQRDEAVFLRQRGYVK